MCQELCKLDDSRQSYCKYYLAYFFWPTLYLDKQTTILRAVKANYNYETQTTTCLKLPQELYTEC